MKDYRVSSLVKGKTHIYSCSLTQDDQIAVPRCKPSVRVKKSNTKTVNQSTMKSYIQNGYVCPCCLRYKENILISS
jgi:hypothetical protein